MRYEIPIKGFIQYFYALRPTGFPARQRLIVTPVSAAGITVTTTVDELNADGDCSLREAIQASNLDAPVDACAAGLGADIITLPAGIYTLTLLGAGEDVNASGDLDIGDPVTVNGAGAGITIIRAGNLGYPNAFANGIDRVFHILVAIPVSFSNVTIVNGKCICDGGGINNPGTLTVTNSAFSGNSADRGGGINNTGSLTLTNSTFSGNATTSGGGGGIRNSGGTLTVTNSTFSSNASISSIGGGIYSTGTLTVTNSTFSGNSAVRGGGIENLGTLHLKNTILANSVGAADCYNAFADTIATNTNNLIETNSASPNKCDTPLVTTDPNLGALADNGGPTQTFAIDTDSSAYNTGDNAACAATDQRGITRPQDGICDIGAYELVTGYNLFLPLILR